MALFLPRWFLPQLCPLTPQCSQPGPWGEREAWGGGLSLGLQPLVALHRLPIGSTGNTELCIHTSDSRGWFLPTTGKMRMMLEAMGGGVTTHCVVVTPEKPNYLNLFQDHVYEEGC